MPTTLSRKKQVTSSAGPGKRSRPDRPLVTIGVPVYNADRYLAEALDSILAQTLEDFEVVICDNASTDSTPQIIAEYVRRDPRVRSHRNERNIGAARNFNRTVELARGRYFKWAAYDDLIAPEFLEVCVDALEREPTALLAQARARVIDDDGQLMRIEGLPAGFENCSPEWLLDTDARRVEFDEACDPARPDLNAASPARRLREIMRSRWMFEQFGVFRLDAMRALPLDGEYERLYGSEKVLMAAVAMHGPVLELDQPLFLRRYHSAQSDNLSHDQWLAYLNPDQVRPEKTITRKPRMPGQVRCFVDFMRQVTRSPLPVRDRLACYMVVFGWCFWLVKLLWRQRHQRGVLFRSKMALRSLSTRLGMHERRHGRQRLTSGSTR